MILALPIDFALHDLLFLQKHIQIFLFTYQVPLITIFMQVRQFTCYCDVVKCVFCSVGFISNKASKKSQELHHTLTLSSTNREGMILSTVKANEFTSQNEYFSRLWMVWF